MPSSTSVRRAAVAAGLIVLLTASLAACGNGSSAVKTTARPTTAAQLVIVSPTPNQVTGPNVDLQLQLNGATVVPATQVAGRLRGDQGHIHVSVDKQLVSMTYGLTQTLSNLTPGKHSLQAEFVATDHLPFANRVVAAVLFTVQG